MTLLDDETQLLDRKTPQSRSRELPAMKSPPQQPGQPFTEEEAAAYLVAYPDERSARALGRAWNWSEDRVQRLLKDFEARSPAPTGAETTAHFPDCPVDEIEMAGPSEEPELDDEWTWCADNANLVTLGQPGIAVYQNMNGHLVIRGEARQFDQQDTIITVEPALVPKLVERLRAVLEEINRK